jgi:acetylornithine deacetylase/succinyl-diaminopimelate desuccinylase-like protein
VTAPPDDTTIYTRPAELLQRLIRFDTTNPPGVEGPLIAYVKQLLDAAGIESRILARDPARPNLLARLPGRGAAPPLLLQGHVDVVTTADQDWERPPFGGEIVDGWLWGRGALDMKGGVAMMIAAVLRARAEGMVPPGDVLLLLLSDEERLGLCGAKFLVEEHAALFAGVRYALGEFGAATVHLAGRPIYPIMVTEKQYCRVRATVRGTGGHASRPVRGAAMGKLGRLLAALDATRLPVHITPVTRAMIEALAPALPPAMAGPVRALLDPAQTDRVLDSAPLLADTFDALLHNVVTPTMLEASTASNVIPSRVTVEMDARLLPGYDERDLRRELTAIIGEDAELELTMGERSPGAPDLTLYNTLAGIVREADPEGTAIPYMLPAVTDGRYFARLGIQTYGFLPMRLPPGFGFYESIHAANERIPVAAVEFGAAAMYQALARCGAEAGA